MADKKKGCGCGCGCIGQAPVNQKPAKEKNEAKKSK